MRTRFAPSPTGLLHIGGVRTALYAYLLAKKSGDNFVLRIEDTDQARTVPGALEDIIIALNQYGIPPDEGVMMKDGVVTEVGDKGPYTQSKRLPIYQKYAQQLLDEGKAYYAFDTKEQLDEMRTNQKQAGNPAASYDASIRMTMKNSLTLSESEVKERLARGDEYVVRLLVDPNQMIEYTDHVRGKVSIKSYTVDDQILLKSDGFPTYHLAVVIDDHLMEIGMVLRGEEWLPSLPKHLLLYDAFGWQKPEFAHLPLLLNTDGSKLSKRHNAVAASDYINKGYLPAALLNFMALLGWNPGTEQDIFTKEELIAQFDIDRVQKAGAVFDTARLDWIQGQWIRKHTPEEFAELIKPAVILAYPAAQDDPDFVKKAHLIQDRLTFVNEAVEMMSYYYNEPQIDSELIANAKQKVTKEMIPQVVQILLDTLEPIEESNWNHNVLKEALFAAATKNDLKNGQILWPMRAILTGLPYSPGAFEVAEAIGKQSTIARLTNAQSRLN